MIACAGFAECSVYCACNDMREVDEPACEVCNGDPVEGGRLCLGCLVACAETFGCGAFVMDIVASGAAVAS